jgi:hypothetical protein
MRGMEGERVMLRLDVLLIIYAILKNVQYQIPFHDL